MSKVRQRYLQKHAQDYCIFANQLYHRGKDKSLRICVAKAEFVEAFLHTHYYLPRGQFSIDVIAKAIMRARLWWPKLVWRCNKCQRYKALIQRDEMPLRPMMGAQAFANK